MEISKNLVWIKSEHPLHIDENIRFMIRYRESIEGLRYIIGKGYNHWVITFSGGKDSTTTLIVALETARLYSKELDFIDIVYSDTRMEIPSIHEFALGFLDYLKNFDRIKNLPLRFHILEPEVEESFWVCLLGRGYPPPHQRFRWCTRRLKISPVEKMLKNVVKPNKTVILTGVRFNESTSRNQRLITSCNRGGECGQGIWFQHSSRLKVGYLAPIVNWQECDVWDFLNFYAPSLGYPTQKLERGVYNGRGTRFGCWMCTVVKQDKAMEKIISLPQWSHLKPLMEFRQRVMEIAYSPDSRVRRKDGRLGRLKLEVRKQLLSELLKLQGIVGMQLITDEEVKTIKKFWKNKRYGGE
jgi:DNA sulfur modification protein DndC